MISRCRVRVPGGTKIVPFAAVVEPPEHANDPLQADHAPHDEKVRGQGVPLQSSYCTVGPQPAVSEETERVRLRMPLPQSALQFDQSPHIEKPHVASADRGQVGELAVAVHVCSSAAGPLHVLGRTPSGELEEDTSRVRVLEPSCPAHEALQGVHAVKASVLQFTGQRKVLHIRTSESSTQTSARPARRVRTRD